MEGLLQWSNFNCCLLLGSTLYGHVQVFHVLYNSHIAGYMSLRMHHLVLHFIKILIACVLVQFAFAVNYLLIYSVKVLEDKCLTILEIFSSMRSVDRFLDLVGVLSIKK